MKTNDITIASFPKAGVSYLGYLLTTARAHHNKLDIRPTFFNIDWLLLDEGQMKGIDRADIWHDGMGDFVKTHAERHSSPGRRNVVYVLRNPYDTLRSYYHFLTQWNGEAPGTPRQFLDTPKVGINAWLRHVQSWVLGQKPSEPIYVVQYESLVTDPGVELYELFAALGFRDLSDEALGDALYWSSLANMRRLEGAFSANNPGYQRFNMEFVRPGDKREVDGFEQHRGYIEQQTAKIYEAVKSKLP